MTHQIYGSGFATGQYAGTFDAYAVARVEAAGAPLLDLQGGVYDLTGAPEAAYAKAHVDFAFDDAAPSSGVCDGTDGTTTDIYEINATVDYKALIVMRDGSVCRDEGKATVAAASSVQSGTPSGSMTVSFGPPPAAGSDASCSTPALTVTPSTDLPRKQSTKVTIDGTGFAPGQSLRLVQCNAYNTEPGQCPAVNYAQADEDGDFSVDYFSAGTHYPLSCDNDGAAPCRIVAVDNSLGVATSGEASISYVPYPTISTVGASTTIPNTLEVTGTNLDQFRWIDMISGSCAFFAGAPYMQDTPGYMNQPWVVINEWSGSRISVTWNQYLDSCGRHVRELRLSDDIREASNPSVSFDLPAVINPDSDGDTVPDHRTTAPRRQRRPAGP